MTTKILPNVSKGVIEIPPALAEKAKGAVTKNGTPELESGPYPYAAADHSSTMDSRTYDLHAAQGPIAQHMDGAGQTLGLVLIAEGRHTLVVNETELALEAGCVFHIDSDRMHGTRCDRKDGLLVFMTSDWLGETPDQNHAQFANNALNALQQGNNQVELATIATISTLHVDGESAKILNKRFEEGVQIEDEYHWINYLQWAGFHYGWLLSIGGSMFDEKDGQKEHEHCKVPESIMAAARLARKRGAKWLCFDSDVPESDGLTVYDW